MINKILSLGDRIELRKPAALSEKDNKDVTKEHTKNSRPYISQIYDILDGEQLKIAMPIEEGRVTIHRRGNNYVFPSRFTLVAATNPCKCGYWGDPDKACSCTQTEIEKYRGRLSGPIADRIDMFLEINRVDYRALTGTASESTEEMAERVLRAREIQEKRFCGRRLSLNAQMQESDLKEFCELGRKETAFMKKIYEKQHLSPRRYHKILKTARTIADVRGSNEIEVSHLSAALGYTNF